MAQTWAFGTLTSKDQASSGASTIVINKPASTADGDLLVGLVNGDPGQTQTGPAGWTQITGSPQSVGGGLKGSVWYKIASSEGASWTWTSSGGNYYVGCVGRWTGLQASPLDVSNGAVNANTTTVVAPAVTTTVTDDLVTRLVTTSNATTCTFASGTSRISIGSAGDLAVVYEQYQATAATTGTNTATAQANNMVAFTATFKQSTAAGLPPGLTGPSTEMSEASMTTASHAAMMR